MPELVAQTLENLRDQIRSQKPTDQQASAIFADELEFLLRAAPGSGKTWTSSRRFIWRGASWPYSVGGLALLSFTNSAIREFQEATTKIGRRNLLSEPNYVGTFDAFVERFILTPFGHLVAGLTKRPRLFIAPRPGDRKNRKLNVWVDLSNRRRLQVPAWEIIPFSDNGMIAYKASRSFGGGKLKFEQWNPVNELMSLGFYTHAQRVYWACQLLSNRPHIANCIAKRFPEILVDEAQDTNVWLLILLSLLRDYGTKVALVGDPDQCIYEFSMADATSLPELKKQWKIPEKPLSQSFRCNNRIASAVRYIGGNLDFCGRGDDACAHMGPFIVREPTDHFSHSISEFQRALDRAGLKMSSGAIVCRGHQQLDSIRGEAKYVKLKGMTRDLARAAFLRDCRRDYKLSFQLTEAVIRSITEHSSLWERCDESPDSDEARGVRLAIWRFVKSPTKLPTVSLSGSKWIANVRESLAALILELGIENAPNINLVVKKTGLDTTQVELALFEPQSLFPPIRQETIHQVKGESIDAVLVLGRSKFWTSVVNSTVSKRESEDRRLAYVAMTRARHLLLVGLPSAHFDNNVEVWKSWGFTAI